eukprot:3295174-Prorocentrum_lima.AAC.1
MELPEGLQHVRFELRTGLIIKEKTLILLIWMKSNHLWPAGQIDGCHWMFLKTSTRDKDDE